jgi:hypothetical protein
MAELSRIKPGDLVQVDVNGSLFVAEARGREGRKLKIGPVAGAIRVTYTQVTGHQVRKHWRLTKNVRKVGAQKDEGQDG